MTYSWEKDGNYAAGWFHGLFIQEFREEDGTITRVINGKQIKIKQ